jgi:hypothetical protein
MYRADVVTAILAAEQPPFQGDPPYLVRLINVSRIDFEQLLAHHGFIVTAMDHQTFDDTIDLVCSIEPSTEQLLFHALGMH